MIFDGNVDRCRETLIDFERLLENPLERVSESESALIKLIRLIRNRIKQLRGDPLREKHEGWKKKLIDWWMKLQGSFYEVRFLLSLAI